METLTTRMLLLRRRTGKSEKEIAAVPGCKISTYRNYELGIRSPRISTVFRLSCYYHVSTDYLIGLTDYDQEYPSKPSPSKTN